MTGGPGREDLLRHLQDLRTDTYEGAVSRAEREEVFRRAVELLGPVVQSELQAVNRDLLDGSGTVRAVPVGEDADAGGLAAEWQLAWPRQEQDEHRFEHRPLPPVAIRAVFPPGWTHGHLVGSRLGSWPMQIVDETDASRQAASRERSLRLRCTR